MDLRAYGYGFLTARKICFPQFSNCLWGFTYSLKKINMAVKGDYRENYLSPSFDFQKR